MHINRIPWYQLTMCMDSLETYMSSISIPHSLALTVCKIICLTNQGPLSPGYLLPWVPFGLLPRFDPGFILRGQTALI